MDPSHILHIVWGLLIMVVGFFGKRLYDRVDQHQKDLTQHQIEDSHKFAVLETQNSDTMRRLQAIEGKIDILISHIAAK